jgi:arsenite-transporting ATPase
MGKGGVGKTTVSSAYAVMQAARSRKRIALLSSDPAHSLTDVFERESHEFNDEFIRVPVNGKGELQVAQIDAEKGIKAFLEEHRPELLNTLEQGTFFTRDEIGPLLETTIPGMAEIAALLRIDDLLESQEFDEIVVDTAPMGHTLRLLELPQSFLRLLDFLELAGSRDQVLAETFGGHGRFRGDFIRNWRAKCERILRNLSSEDSQIVMVSSPEQFSLREIERSVRALQGNEPPLRVSQYILNRVPEASDCRRCSTVTAQAEKVRTRLQRLARGAEVRIGRDDGAPILGIGELRAFGEEIFHGKRRKQPGLRCDDAFPEFVKWDWPRSKETLGFSIGKGGVGKTTIAAARAYVTALDHKQRPISVCSADPAPSLDDVFAREIGEERVAVAGLKNLFACEIDAANEFRKWAEPLRLRIDGAFSGERRGVHVELAFEQELFSSLLDIVPPGVDELFAVLRIADMAEDTSRERWIIDMAPTGHALELLRTPARMLNWTRLLMKALAPHRKLALAQEIAVEVASVSQRVRRLQALLREHSEIWMVMVAEPLPDRETIRLQQELHKLELTPSSLFVNRVLVTETRCPRCAQARAWQAKTLSNLARGEAKQLYIVPEFGAEVTGAARLQRFTRSILEWR